MVCLLALLLLGLVTSVTVFIKSAAVLAPWTAMSVLFSGVVVSLFAKGSVGSPAERGKVAALMTFGLSFLFGYAAYGLMPPTAPRGPEGLELLLFEPEPSAQDLLWSFPLHLGVWAGVVAFCVGYRVQRLAKEDEEIRRGGADTKDEVVSDRLSAPGQREETSRPSTPSAGSGQANSGQAAG